MNWVKSAEISHFEAGSDYSLYPKGSIGMVDRFERFSFAISEIAGRVLSKSGIPKQL